MLVLGAESEAARIVAGANAGAVARGDDAAAIASALERLVDSGLPEPTGGIDEYSWTELAARWEREIDAAVAGA